MLIATRRIFPVAPSLSSSDTDTGNQLVSFNAAAEKSLILTDLYSDLLSFSSHFFKDLCLPSG